jgi:hypothetical protein
MLERLESTLNREFDMARWPGTGACGTRVARTVSRRGGVRCDAIEALSRARLGRLESVASESLASLSVGISESVFLCKALSSTMIFKTRIASGPNMKNEKKYCQKVSAEGRIEKAISLTSSMA